MVPKLEMDTRQRSSSDNEMETPMEKKFNEDLASWPNSPLWETNGIYDTMLMSPHKWLKKKQAFDNIGRNVWRVRDGLYDLRDFIKKHPGGSDWIEVTEGTDITELFLSSHVVNMKMIESVLKKYYVRPAEGPRKSPYTFNENDFYMTLKRRVEPILKKSGTKPSVQAGMIQDFLGLSFVLSAIVATMNNSYLGLFGSGFLLFWLVFCTHNFCHSKDNWRKWYFTMSMIEPQEARIWHCVSHHVFPNTRMDFETIAAEPFMMHRHLGKQKSFVQRFLPILYMNIIMPGALPFNFVILKMYRIFVLGEHKFKKENLVPFVQGAILCALAPTFGQGFISWAIIHFVCSYFFLGVGYAVAHHDTSCYHDGDRMRNNPDWGMCQMDATRDTPTDASDNLIICSITFGEHPLHHMFPTVCHSKFHLLKPILKETMKEFGMDYPKLTQWEQFLGYIKNFTQNAPNPIAFGNTSKATSTN